MNILRISIVFLIICALIESCTQPPKSITRKAVVKPAPIGSITKKDTIKPVIITDLKLKQSVDDINHFLALYDTLSPFGEYKLKAFHIRKKDLDMDDNLSETKGKISGLGLIGYYQDIILNKLNDILYNKHIADYKLEDILDTQHIAITHSDDGRLYDVVLDAKSGGSYRSQLSFVQYRAEDGNIYNYPPSDTSSTDVVFNTDGYGSIITMKTAYGTKYLLQGDVMGCNTCEGNYIALVSFKNGKFFCDFSYNLDIREGGTPDSGGTLSYDKESQTISVDYITDDLTPECTCDDYEKVSQKRADSGIYVTSDQTDYGKHCSCVFKFNGSTFIQETKKHKIKTGKN